jgi:hypothetical protein
MKTATFLSLLIALVSLAVSFFVYFQTEEHFALQAQPFFNLEDTVKNEQLIVRLANVQGSEVLEINDLRVGEPRWRVVEQSAHGPYKFIPSEDIKGRSVGTGKTVDLLRLEIRHPDELDQVPDEMPFEVKYLD